jgi:hypothetical protein
MQHLGDDLARSKQTTGQPPNLATVSARSRPAGHKHLRLWKWLAFGSGVALAVAGGIVFARNGSCRDSDCGDEESARTVGVTLLSVGALGIGAGGVLLLVDK